jgi:competence protein ComFC
MNMEPLEKIKSFKTLGQRAKDALLDFFLPQKKNVKYLESLSGEDIVLRTEPAQDLDIKNAEAIFSYKDPLIRSLVWQLKYKGNRKIASTLAEILYERVLITCSDLSLFENFSKPIFIPIPTDKNKSREKGFNQTEILLEEIMKLDKEKAFEYMPSVLIKIKETKNQTSIKRRAERLENLKGCFAVQNTEAVKGRNILLIDDVITTGATIKEARRALKESGAQKIWAFTLAH